MQLPAIREKLSTISIRRKILFLISGFLILFLLLIVVEVNYCLKSEFCLLRIASFYPSLGKVMGVKETEFGFKKGNFTIDKNLDLITVSGEIVEVEKSRLTIILEDGSKRTVSVREGSRFLILSSSVNEEGRGENYTFNGNNLEEFLFPGDDLGQAGFFGSEIFSDYIDNKGGRDFPIVVLQQEY